MATSQIRYADLWALLRKLGFDCDTVLESNHRVCENTSTDTRIVLHNYPPEQLVREQILVIVRLQLDGHSVLPSEDFNAWVARRTRANARISSNGSAPAREPRKRTMPSE